MSPYRPLRVGISTSSMRLYGNTSPSFGFIPNQRLLYKGQIPDYERPVILFRQKSTIEEFCNKIHRGILSQFKYAFAWGSSVKHNPQKVGKEHQLLDEDIVQLVKK
jgi:hypothetical protein